MNICFTLGAIADGTRENMNLVISLKDSLGKFLSGGNMKYNGKTVMHRIKNNPKSIESIEKQSWEHKQEGKDKRRLKTIFQKIIREVPTK